MQEKVSTPLNSLTVCKPLYKRGLLLGVPYDIGIIMIVFSFLFFYIFENISILIPMGSIYIFLAHLTSKDPYLIDTWICRLKQPKTIYPS